MDGISTIVLSVGVAEADIEVVLLSSLACFISIVPIPLNTELARPTVIVLITHVVPIPAFGVNSTLSKPPSSFAS